MTDTGHIDWYPTDAERAAKRDADCAEARRAALADLRAVVAEKILAEGGDEDYWDAWWEFRQKALDAIDRAMGG